MNYTAISKKLRVLGDRDWPAQWDAAASQECGDFLGWSHRYRMFDPVSEAEVASFEREQGISLPIEYRRFITEFGNGGAGPGYGIFPLGESEEGSLPDEVLHNLSLDFPHDGPWNDEALLRGDAPDEAYYDYSVMAGAMEIATEGCALFYLLVISGRRAGEIWFDERTEGKGLRPVRDQNGKTLAFAEWYEHWLELAWSRFGPR